MKDKPLGRIVWRPMYEEVRQQILRYIEENDLWGRQLISERELASVFGVSRGTVRRGVDLLEQEGVVATQGGRRARVLPRREDTERGTSCIAVAAFEPGIGGSYGACIVTGVASRIADAGSSLSFFDLRELPSRSRFFESITDGNVQGVVLVSIVDRATVARVLDLTAVPVVLADHWFPDLPVTAVIDDSAGGARQAVEHLISLGHRRIGYIEIVHREWNPWRYEGYAAGLRAAGIGVTDELVVPAASFEGALTATAKLLDLPDPPTAIFAFDQTRAWGVWAAAEARGLVVGRDLAIIGYGGQPKESGPMANLSSVCFDPLDLGRTAADELSRLMQGQTHPGRVIKVPTELKVRMSSAGEGAA